MKNSKIKTVLIYICESFFCIFAIVNCISYWASDVDNYPMGVNPISFIAYIGAQIMFTVIFIKDIKKK